MARNVVIFTIAAKNYLSYVRTLFHSVVKQSPEHKCYLFLADRIDNCFDPQLECFNVIEVEDIGVPNLKEMAFRYDITEFSTAVKPFVFQWIFANIDCDSVVYLDPDIMVFSPLSEVESWLEKGVSVVATPHITQPLEDTHKPSDLDILQAGVFNLGFIAFNRCPESDAFLRWWADRLVNYCTFDKEQGLFVDQKWCDFLPCFVDNLVTLRDPGYNVAYWNMAYRNVFREGVSWKVNGRPLAFFHFSGVNPNRPDEFSKHQDRFSLDDIGEAAILVREYMDKLRKHGWEEGRAWPYAYDYFNNGERINKYTRRIYKELRERGVLQGMTDPFSVENTFFCNEAEDSFPQHGVGTITRLMCAIWRERKDLQQAFLLNTCEGQEAFSAWFAMAAGYEYGFDDRYMVQPKGRNDGMALESGVARGTAKVEDRHSRLWLRLYQMSQSIKVMLLPVVLKLPSSAVVRLRDIWLRWSIYVLRRC